MIDHPRFANYRDLVARIPERPSIAALDAILAPLIGLRLVESGKTKAAKRPDGTIDPSSLYEVHIVETRTIPTRPDNLHDLLNALVWAAFPHAKWALTSRVAAIQCVRVAGRSTLPFARSREHDRLALIDEGGVLIAPRGAWIFGHAILEHAIGGKDVRGTRVPIATGETRAEVDRAFAAWLAGDLETPPFGEPIDDTTLVPA